MLCVCCVLESLFAFVGCHNEDGRIQLRKREFITRSNTQRELKVELSVGQTRVAQGSNGQPKVR